MSLGDPFKAIDDTLSDADEFAYELLLYMVRVLHLSAYEVAARYLRKLRPVYESLDRAGEWTALVASIRERYRNRPRFMEALDSVEGKTIVQSARGRRK